MKHLTLGLTLIPLLALIGCGSDPAVSDGPAPAVPDDMTPPQVAFTSTDLADATRVGRITRTLDANGLMHLSVPIRAATDFDLTVDYRFTFLDDAHAVVDQPASWQTRTLHAGTFEYLDGTAPSAKASDFELDVRYAK